MADDRWLVVGLGNPEAEYGRTRHNVGADVVRLLGARHRSELARNKKVQCALAEVRESGERLVLAVPDGYMNESGGPVQKAAAYFKVAPDRIIVVHDDLDLEVGDLRVKQGGGHGGHNGLRDIDNRLSTPEYLRVRVGIGRPPGRQDPKDHVLRRFNPADRATIDVTLEHAADAIVSLVIHGLEPTQNAYHGVR